MIYARSLHNVTVHLTHHQDTRGPALCGHTPRWDAWRGQDHWEFYTVLPEAPGSYGQFPAEEYLCRRCQKQQIRFPQGVSSYWGADEMSNDYRAKRVSLQVWIDEEQRDALKHLAIERRQSVTEIIRSMVAAELAKGPPTDTISTERYAIEGLEWDDLNERFKKLDATR